jgi:protein gp37
MSEDSAIQWTDHTFNPWWGCARVSPACVRCYADSLARRWGHDEIWRRKGPRRMMSDATWRNPVKWNRDAQATGFSALVFCASMADVFEIHPVVEVNAQLDAARARLWPLIEQTPWLTWQLLTKRPENVAELTPWDGGWPDNVWLGTSVENQRFADERVPVLVRIPAAVRFLSCEPLLGPVDLSAWLDTPPSCGCGIAPEGAPGAAGCSAGCMEPEPPAIEWVIAGGESGPGFRSLDLDHTRSLRDQCATAGVPFLFKQVGGRTSKAGGRELDGRTWDEMPERAR